MDRGLCRDLLAYRGMGPGPPCKNLDLVRNTVRAFSRLIEAPEHAVEQLLETVETVCTETNGHTFIERDPHLSTMQLAVNRSYLLLRHRNTFLYRIAPYAAKLTMDAQYLNDLRKNSRSYRQALQGFRRNVEQHAAKRAEVARKAALARRVVAALGGAYRAASTGSGGIPTAGTRSAPVGAAPHQLAVGRGCRPHHRHTRP
jgi:hypothetical protein